MKVVVSIYNPTEFYPPTLNAIEYLAKYSGDVSVLSHAVAKSDRWEFPGNVSTVFAGEWPSMTHKSGAFRNILRFIQFVSSLRKLLAREKPDLVLLYEPYALLAYQICLKLGISKAKVLWYHNHDIYEKKSQGRFSVGRWAIAAEEQMMKRIDIFSLPANERKEFFNTDELKGRYYFLPNYPSRLLYDRFYKEPVLTDEIRLIYQGRIGEGHGIEQILKILNTHVSGKKLSLHLKGIINDDYKLALQRLAQEYGVTNSLFFYGITSYKEVPALASTCHVGIAIHTKSDVMNQTLGTSSNKIYEYAAVGLPVLLYDNPHFKDHLSQYQWAFFTDCTENSLLDSLQEIVASYPTLSKAAHDSFVASLNFENGISSIVETI